MTMTATRMSQSSRSSGENNRWARALSLREVIPQKLKLPMNLFENFPECSLPSTVSKNTMKMIGRHACLRYVTAYPIFAFTRANHARYSSVQVIHCGNQKHSLLK